jgi:hypothetical protein
METRNIDALKRVWPSLGGNQEGALRREFQHARAIDVGIDRPDVVVTGQTATITFIRRYHVATVDGQQLLTTSRSTMTARQAGTDWVIERLHFEPVR